MHAKLNIVELFKSFRTKNSTEFSRAILELNALDALEHSHFGIYLDTKDLAPGENGYYDMKNKVVIKVKDNKQSVSDTPRSVFHELTHKAVDRVFKNSAIPYSKDNVIAKKAYDACIRQVLLNLVDAVFPLDNLEQLDTSGTCYLNNSSGRARLNFPHKWSRSMPLNQLVENCFASKYGMFVYPNMDYCFNKAYIEDKNGKKIWSKAGNYDEYGTPEERSNFIAGLAQCLDGVFGNYYRVRIT